jgi:hypothetical protein
MYMCNNGAKTLLCRSNKVIHSGEREMISHIIKCCGGGGGGDDEVEEEEEEEKMLELSIK